VGQKSHFETKLFKVAKIRRLIITRKQKAKELFKKDIFIKMICHNKIRRLELQNEILSSENVTYFSRSQELHAFSHLKAVANQVFQRKHFLIQILLLCKTMGKEY